MVKTGYYHTDEAISNGESWTRLFYLLIKQLETATFLLWALKNKDEVSANAANPTKERHPHRLQAHWGWMIPLEFI